MLRVLKLEGEATRFHVESNSLQCIAIQGCKKLFSKHRRPDLRIGGKCPNCGGQLDVRFHLVDIAAYGMNGECSCEFFEFTMRPKLVRSHPSTWPDGKHRCSHIDCARDFALDVALKAQHHDRYAKTGRREED